jgi:hypothetical protein
MKISPISLKNVSLLSLPILIASNTLSIGSVKAIGLTNPGFENNSVTTLQGLGAPDVIQGGGNPGFVIVTQDNSVSGTNITGWRTTATDFGIELWQSGFAGGAANPVLTASTGGSQFAELNATQATTLFQNLQLGASASSTQLYFSFLHRARANNSSGGTFVNAVNVQILDGATILFNKVFATQLVDNGSANQADNGWARYTSEDFAPIFAAAGGARNITYQFAAVSLNNGSADIFSTTGTSPTRTFNATGITTTNSDLSFGNFLDTANLSDTPSTVGVPFDFEANVGIGILGALYLGRKAFKSWKSNKDSSKEE